MSLVLSFVPMWPRCCPSVAYNAAAAAVDGEWPVSELQGLNSLRKARRSPSGVGRLLRDGRQSLAPQPRKGDAMNDLDFGELIQRCNHFLDCMYDAGVLRHGSPQHIDLVRTFFAGAIEALMLAGHDRLALPLGVELEHMTARDWRPDERFVTP